jgi:predicted ATP-grasp superfamily ATP-dependent carboligase
MYTGALENHPELVDQLAWLAPLWGNPGDVLKGVRSPWELANVLDDAGLLFPETRDSADGLPRDGSWLVKTSQGASGSGVRAWSGERGARSWEQDGLPPVCFQRRVAGIPCSAVFVGERGAATPLGVTRQLIGESWLGSHGFQYAGSIGPLPLLENVLATIARLGNVLAAQFELVGLFGVDMIVDGERVWTLEVNPRYTASVEIVERYSGASSVEAHAAACSEVLGAGDWGPEKLSHFGLQSVPTTKYQGRSPQSPIAHTSYHGKAVLYAKRDLVITPSFAQSSLAEALRKPWPTLADVSPANTLVEAGRPIMTIFASATSINDVEVQLRIRAQEFERHLYGSEAPS